jgi:DNA-binding MarR family transcriptional regulator
MRTKHILDETEHITDIFTRIVLKTLTQGIYECTQDELTFAQYQALRHVAQHGPCTVGSLAEGLSVSQPAATMSVDRLARRGLVERRPGSVDRRQAEVLLTEKSRLLLCHAEEERLRRLGEILNVMQPEEREELLLSMKKFVSAALKVEPMAEGACLRCGVEHNPDCIVNKTRIEIEGKEVERT